MATLSPFAPSVRADFADAESFEPHPCDAAWVAGHDLGMDGIDAGPDPELGRDEADAFRRGYAAGLDAGGWSLDLMFLGEPGDGWPDAERIAAVGVLEARRQGGAR